MKTSQILTVVIYCLQVDLILIKLMDMGYNEIFSDPHCSYILPTGGSGVNHIGGHAFQ